MANVYCQTAFILNATNVEANNIVNFVKFMSAYCEALEVDDPLPSTPTYLSDDAFEKILESFADPEWPVLGLKAELVNTGEVYCYAEENFDEDAVSTIIRALCPSALPFEFTYATWCEKLRPNCFSGGTITIEA